MSLGEVMRLLNFYSEKFANRIEFKSWARLNMNINNTEVVKMETSKQNEVNINQ